MTYLEFTVDSEPVGKGRPRFTKSGHAYTPEKTADYEELVKVSFRKKYPDFKPIEKDIPLYAVIEACFKIPKNTGRKTREKMLSGSIRHTKKPDGDNIAKAVLDALNGLAYHDDSQISMFTVVKKYSDCPCVKIYIDEWRGE